MCARACDMCSCVVIKLQITAQSSPVILGVITCHSYWSSQARINETYLCACVCVCSSTLLIGRVSTIHIQRERERERDNLRLVNSALLSLVLLVIVGQYQLLCSNPGGKSPTLECGRQWPGIYPDRSIGKRRENIMQGGERMAFFPL